MDKKSVAKILGHDNNVPIIACFKNDYNSLTFICPACKEQHYHGAGDKFGDGDGHRSSHCKEMRNGGYYIKEVKDWELAGYLHKYDRDAKSKQRIKTIKYVEKYLFGEFCYKRNPELEITKNRKTYNVRWSHYPMVEDRLFSACINPMMAIDKDNLWNKYIDSFTRRSEMFSGGSSGSLRYVDKHIAYEMYELIKKYYIQALYRMKEVGYKDDTDYLKFREMSDMVSTALTLFQKTSDYITKERKVRNG